MDSHEVGAAGERPLDHELGEGSDHGGEDVTSAEHGLADGHEVGDGMVAIADELLSGISIRSGRNGAHRVQLGGVRLLVGCSLSVPVVQGELER